MNWPKVAFVLALETSGLQNPQQQQQQQSIQLYCVCVCTIIDTHTKAPFLGHNKPFKIAEKKTKIGLKEK